ncbi:hypothetical protein AVEN_24615-1 [Araneus ventricosus]|uniref:Tc1-like transposase DDE domain-containing protein n=1 Tax=Araneus ventricosus TaxID=182803 RepID=A0A4Y2IJ86_ARAVE|nr:hypothetical protein AVEN_24615-1 [Araneus ventricosus]
MRHELDSPNLGVHLPQVKLASLPRLPPKRSHNLNSSQKKPNASHRPSSLLRDGAPPHYGNIVREFLETTFLQRWIGRGAVMAWPPRSPDITPLDLYLWGYVKQQVYSERINDMNHLTLQPAET